MEQVDGKYASKKKCTHKMRDFFVIMICRGFFLLNTRQQYFHLPPRKKTKIKFYGFESARWILKANLRQLIRNDGYYCRAIFTAKKIFVITFSSYLIYFSIVLKMMKLCSKSREKNTKV